MKYFRWLKRIWRWLMEFQIAWLAGLVTVLAVSIAWAFGATEPAIRDTGLVLQLLGIFTVVVGIDKTRRFFGYDSVGAVLLAWLGRFPPLNPKGATGTLHGDLGGLEAKGRGYRSAPVPTNATDPERIAVLEKNIDYIHERINQFESEMDQELRKHADQIAQEKAARVSGEHTIQKKIEDSATGGLDVSAMGALWLFVGTILATIPGDIAGWFN